MESAWKLYVETVFTTVEDIEHYIRANPEAEHDGYVQARLRELRGEAGTYPTPTHFFFLYYDVIV